MTKLTAGENFGWGNSVVVAEGFTKRQFECNQTLPAQTERNGLSHDYLPEQVEGFGRGSQDVIISIELA